MKTIWLTSAAVLLPALLAPAAALAQAAPTATSAAEAAEDDNAIVVTATRRSQLLSDVPIAVSAVSQEQLQNSGAGDIRQLNQLAPSLLVSSATNESNGAARIRGIGTVGENPGLESSVALFIDGVYRSRTGVGLSDLGQIERVEVLRGPQGTLFGRNASAGLLNITTAQPKFEFGGQGEFTYGNFNNIRFVGGIHGPILGDKIAFRIDGLYNKRDGFLRDVVSGRDLADRDRYLIRGKLLFKPTDDLSILLIGDYSSRNEECCGAPILAPNRNIARDAAGNLVFTPNNVQGLVSAATGGNPLALYRLPTDGSAFVRETSITPGASYNQRTRDWGVSGEINYDFGDAKLTSITGYREFRNKAAQDADFNFADILRRDDQNRKFQTFSQEVRFQGQAFGERLDYLVGAYYAREILRTDDNLVYGNDYERYINAQLAGLAAFGPGGNVAAVAAAAGFTPPAGQSLLNNTGIVQGGFFRQTSTNYAFFTHNVISIIPDKLMLTLGLRYTNENKDITADFRSNNNLCGALRAAPAFDAATVPLATRLARAGVTGLSCVINNTTPANFVKGTPGTTRNEGEFTGTVVLSYKPVEELLTYASYSRGYKAGGFNLDTSALDAPCNLATDNAPTGGNLSCTQRRALPANTPGNARGEASDLQFQQETVDAFEFGAKLDLRELKINAAVFFQKFSNFQLNTFNGINFEVTNISACKDDLAGRDRDLLNNNSQCTGKLVPGVVSKGIEIEAALYPVRDVAINAGLTYNDARYQRNLTGLGGASLASTLFQLPGQLLSNSSNYVLTGSFAWTPQINETFSALAYFDFRYQSDTNTGSDLDFEKVQKGFIVANARIGLYGPKKRWGIEFWGQNIFNEKFQQVAADAPLQGGGTLRGVQRGLAATANQVYITFPAEPRVYGVTLRTQF